METLTKKQKIESLTDAMTQSQRDGEDTKFTHFTDSAPEELKDAFLEHYEVRDQDYEIFKEACEIVADIYNDEAQENDGLEFVEDAIYERASDLASPYTADRLAYLNIWNQEEITDNVRELSCDIATAAAYWYDKQVEQACFIIKEWIEA